MRILVKKRGCNLQGLLKSVEGYGQREFEKIAGRGRSKSTAIALDLGIIRGTVLISLAERISVESVQGTRY